MASEAPPFWWERPDWRAWALWPVSAAYGAIAAHRLKTAPRREIDVPVLCIGNFTVGGAGKTPTAIAFARAARAMNLEPGFLSRGHGGNFSRPHVVDRRHDSARRVGDEPLLLAQHAPVAVTANRAEGAKLLAEQGCDLVIMDDGFQSARVAIDYALMVVDAHRGLGNGHVIPAGPMRAPLIEQLRFTDGVLRVGVGDGANTVIRMAARANKPVYQASARVVDDGRIAGRRVLAFAGIGDPGKFYATLRGLGAEIAVERSFPDHHNFRHEDIADLASIADQQELDLVTTEKDAVRFHNGTGEEQAFLERVRVVRIETDFEVERTPLRILEDTVAAWRKRRA
ncbi:MAG: tetraacyldisaccharide 4'-kinase [Rhizobiaceae bacterium]